jgi:hypothetical protein
MNSRWVHPYIVLSVSSDERHASCNDLQFPLKLLIKIKLSGLGWGWGTKAWLMGALLLLAGFHASGRTVPDPGNPLGFFTTVADKMLRSTFPFGVTNIPVCSNGVYVYTPAVQRLLQLSANLCDASNTNFFPSVFRPLFASDTSNNVFIIGYLQVTNVSGTTDPQLAQPYDVMQVAGIGGTPIADSNGPVNVYGVPWIIGAKKGLPNFNQFYMFTTAQVTRKFQVTRNSLNPMTAIYVTNQMYLMGISNSVGVSFWNSYSNAYPRPVAVYVSGIVCMSMTNEVRVWPTTTYNFMANLTVANWFSSQWSGTLPNTTPAANSFCNTNWSFTYLNPSSYDFATANFDVTPVWHATSPPLLPLPQFGLLVTNHLQAFILDSNNVIDYVQLRDPVNVGGLNQALADPDYTNPAAIYYQWSTNAINSSSTTPYGVLNQLYISGHPPSPYGPTPPSLMPVGGQWSTAPTVMGLTTPDAEASFYDGFFVPSFQYKGQVYINNQLSMEAPYTPLRMIYSSYLLQANDPLVHYLSSDLSAQVGTWSVWAGSTGGRLNQQNGFWYHSDDPQNQPTPTPPVTPIGGRYQPWLRKGQMSLFNTNVVAPVTNNYSCKDPLAYSSDSWNFPTNLMQSLAGLGQVHRGTSWQTVYLKDADLLGAYTVTGATTNYVGTNTWMQWTGDLNANDAALMAPVSDWRLAGLLMSLLNTNDPTQLFSVNDSNVADWQNLLNGMVVYSNSASVVFPTTPLQFTTFIMASNSPQASAIATAIVQMGASQSRPPFYSIGDILTTSALTAQSPFLNLGSMSFGQQQMNYGISDFEYEAIPSQLLPLLRPDSIGALTSMNGDWNLQFSGADGYSYLLQTSTNLTDWHSLGTNQPMGGSFNVPVGTATTSPGQFFRTVLVH